MVALVAPYLIEDNGSEITGFRFQEVQKNAEVLTPLRMFGSVGRASVVQYTGWCCFKLAITSAVSANPAPYNPANSAQRLANASTPCP